MIGFVPLSMPADELPLPTGPQLDPPTYAHPSAALADVQTIAAAEGAAVLVLVSVDGEWRACCPTCLVAVGGRHDCTQRSGEAVDVFGAVYRPADTVREP